MGTHLGRWIVGVVVVVVALGAWTLSRGGDGECEQVPGARPGLCIVAVADRPAAPTTSLPVLGDPTTELSLQAFPGDVVVVNFWGSWCAPCRVEQPDLNEVALAYRDRGVSFLGVDVAEISETNGIAHQEEFEIPYPSLWDPAFTYAADFEVIGPQGMPATVLVDRDGLVAASFFGQTTRAEVSAVLDVLLAESSPA
jgi:thiol-disulfide isomerase/thioredoxin